MSGCERRDVENLFLGDARFIRSFVDLVDLLLSEIERVLSLCVCEHVIICRLVSLPHFLSSSGFRVSIKFSRRLFLTRWRFWR